MEDQNYPQGGEARLNDQGFRALMENANDAIFVLDEKGVILSVNRQAEELLGYTKNTLVGSFYQSLLVTEDVELAAEEIKKVYGGEGVHTIVRLKALDGRVVFVEFSGSFVHLGGQKILLGIGRDLTDRLKAEENNIRLASVVESSGDAIYGTDMEGTITVWNPAAEKLYGYGAPEIIGKSVLALAPADRHVESLRLLEDCKQGVIIPLFKTIRKNRRMEKIHVSLTLSPLRNRDGRITGISVIARDLTEQKKTEEAFRKSEESLRQAQKMEAVGQLAAGVAHDFNNLLSVITGYSDSLLLEMPEGDPRMEELLEIKKTALRGAELTKQLLIFGRKNTFQPVVLNLKRVVKDTGQMLQRMVGEDMELSLKIDPDLGRIKSDPVQIQQILMNLCANARDAMPQGGSLLIESRNVIFNEPHQRVTGEVAPGSYVLLSVSDTGTGIDPEVIHHIFEPFFTTKEIGKGTGLGLANVYSIVKESGGHVWVYSEKGKGCTFNIIFPSVEEDEAEPSGPGGNKSLTGSETILLVEDEEPLRRILSRQLQKQGYRVLEASNGQEGLDMAVLNPSKINLLLTDTIMPKMNGRQLADILRDVCSHTRVLFMSGYPREVLSQQGIVESPVHLIQKPFSSVDLFLKIRMVLEDITAVG